MNLLAERLWESREKVWIGSLGLLFMVGMFTQRMAPRVALLTNEMKPLIHLMIASGNSPHRIVSIAQHVIPISLACSCQWSFWVLFHLSTVGAGALEFGRGAIGSSHISSVSCPQIGLGKSVVGIQAQQNQVVTKEFFLLCSSTFLNLN